MPSSQQLSKPKYLYLTTTGRVTGRPHEIEIWFVEYASKLYVLAEHFHDAQWVRNIKTNSKVSVRLGSRRFEATARVLDYNRDREAWLTAQRLAREEYDWGEGLPVELTPKLNRL